MGHAPVVYALVVLFFFFIPGGLLLSRYIGQNLKKQFVDAYAPDTQPTGSQGFAPALRGRAVASLNDLWIWLKEPVDFRQAPSFWRSARPQPEDNSKPASLPSATAP